MNYCCAMGNCSACVLRHAAARERRAARKAREERIALLGNTVWPPEKQNKIVDDVVRSFL